MQPRPSRDPEPIVRVGETGPDVGRQTTDRPQRGRSARGHDRPSADAVARERRSNLVQPLVQLQVDMEADIAARRREEGQRLVERRQLGGEAAQALESQLVHAAADGSVRDLLEPVGVGDDQRPEGRAITSNSTRSTPWSTASPNDRKVFSGASIGAPRCPITSGRACCLRRSIRARRAPAPVARTSPRAARSRRAAISAPPRSESRRRVARVRSRSGCASARWWRPTPGDRRRVDRRDLARSLGGLVARHLGHAGSLFPAQSRIRRDANPNAKTPKRAAR